MHIETAFLSVPVAAACWSASAAGTAWTLRRSKPIALKPLAIATAAVFVAQLSIFDVAVPGTGSSGHFAGGFLLALLLGPAAALLSMAAVLALQVLLVGDGSWYSLGANLLNMGVLPALLVYPFYYKPLAQGASPWRLRALVLSAGLLSVVGGGVLQGLQALLSASPELSQAAFFGQLLPLHLATGLGEGLLSVLALEALAWAPLRNAQRT